MKSESRIPGIREINKRNMRQWFMKMSARGFLFHPDDDPASIVNGRTGVRVFSESEIRYLRRLIVFMFDRQGDGVYEAACPVFMSGLRKIVNG